MSRTDAGFSAVTQLCAVSPFSVSHGFSPFESAASESREQRAIQVSFLVGLKTPSSSKIKNAENAKYSEIAAGWSVCVERKPSEPLTYFTPL